MRTVVLGPGGRLSGEVNGVPDLLATRCLCFGIAFVVLCIGVGLPWLYLASSQAKHAGLGAGFLMFVLAVLLLGLAGYAIRTGWRAGAWFRVDAAGFHYGPGRPDGARKPETGTSVEWQRVVHNPKASCDVRVWWPGEDKGQPRLMYWYRSDDGTVLERSLPLWLRDDAIRCIRFLNAADVHVALLKGLAARPGLRFDPSVFVDTGVDPETWLSMRKPDRVDWIITIVAVAAAIQLGHAFLESWPLAVTVAIVFGVLALGVGAMSGFRKVAYPGFTEQIGFRPE